jgi:hypothetical protein
MAEFLKISQNIGHIPLFLVPISTNNGAIYKADSKITLLLKGRIDTGFISKGSLKEDFDHFHTLHEKMTVFIPYNRFHNYIPKVIAVFELLSIIRNSSWLDDTWFPILASVSPSMKDNKTVEFYYNPFKQPNYFDPDYEYFPVGNISWSFLTCSSLNDKDSGIQFSAYLGPFQVSVWIGIVTTFVCVVGMYRYNF